MSAIKLKCINVEPLAGNDVAPPLELGVEYTLKSIVYDAEGNPHYDVGLKSEFNYIRSWETDEELDRGDKIHWCHPSRFEKVELNINLDGILDKPKEV